MNTWHVLLIVFIIFILILAGRVVYELYNPEIRRYSVKTKKLTVNERMRIVYLSDLHSWKYDENNIRLIKMVSNTKPDFILLGGDMITKSFLKNRDEITLKTLSGLSNIAPVFYAPGNHEKKISLSSKEKERFEDYLFELECMDIAYLADQSAVLSEAVNLYGLDIDPEYYKKAGKKPRFTLGYMYEKIGRPDKNKFNILMAHTPEFFDTYIKGNYDLVLCGHYHGGMVILPKIGPLLSPDLHFLPKHSGGAYKKAGTVVIVSRGIGSHFINLRLFNRPEVVVIDVKSEQEG